MWRSLSCLVAISLVACGSEEPVVGPSDAGTTDGAITDAAAPDAGFDPRYLTFFDSPAAYASLTSADTQGVKYLNPIDLSAPPQPFVEPCYFQHMGMFPFHVQFLQSFPEFEGLSFEGYLKLVLDAERIFYGGEVRVWPLILHPVTQQPGLMTYTLYGDPGTLAKEDIVAVDRALEGCVRFAPDALAFLPSDPAQKLFARQERDALLAEGVAVIFPEELIANVPFEIYSPGEGYGTLRLVPQGQALGAYGIRDVVVVESAPNDISVVAGLITKDPQSTASHVNLRLLEKGIPNAAVPSIYEDALVGALDGHLVHLLADNGGVRIEPARLEDAERFWTAHRPDLPEVQFDLGPTELLGFDTLVHSSSIAYGVKAANLGELFRTLPQDNRVVGFGIPFSAYHRHVTDNGLDRAITSALADPRMQTDVLFKRTTLGNLRDQIRAAPMESSFEDSLFARLREVFGSNAETTRIRFRSSTNVEDLDRVSGAGLYNSRSGCLADDLDGDALGPSRCLDPEEKAWLEVELQKRQQEFSEHPERTYLPAIISEIVSDLSDEKPVVDAVRKVWASLYTNRAFDEREYYGIDHERVFMGIAVNPAFALERVNAVAVTNLDPESATVLVRLVSQVGEESVVLPEDPSHIAEELTFRIDPNTGAPTDVRLLREATLAPGPGQSVWSMDDLTILSGLLDSVQERFEAEVYPTITPLKLDIELKIDRTGRVVLKQARPFSSAF